MDIQPRNYMHRRNARHLRFHEREFEDIYGKAMADPQFLATIDSSKMNQNQIAEAYVLHSMAVSPASVEEVTRR